MTEIAGYTVRTLSGGGLRLDGGAMFGNVPRVLWERGQPADAAHRIALATRLLLLEGDGRRILVDTGTGHLWDEKECAMFAVSAPEEPPVVTALAAMGLKPEDITDVVLTHLHFDHAGGVSRLGPDGDPVPTFQDARHHVQRRNLEAAKDPHPRERASYLGRHIEPLLKTDLVLADGEGEILPGITVTPSDGHTPGLQCVQVGRGKGSIVFPADVAPTADHLRAVWTMGYDLCPRTIIEEKTALLERAEDEGAIIVLEHDATRPALTVGRDAKGRLAPGEAVSI